MDGNLLERSFVNVACAKFERGELKVKTRKDFAKACFPGDATPEKTLQYIRTGQKGKPRKVSISDAYNIAKACEDNLLHLLSLAEVRIQEGWTLDDDVFNDPEAKKPGRRAKRSNEKKANSYQTLPSAQKIRPPQDAPSQ